MADKKINIIRQYEDGIIERYCYSRNIWGVPEASQFYHLPDGTIIYNDIISFKNKEEGNNHFKSLLKQGFKKINY